jgi:hypothetical protein
MLSLSRHVFSAVHDIPHACISSTSLRESPLQRVRKCSMTQLWQTIRERDGVACLRYARIRIRLCLSVLLFGTGCFFFFSFS